MAPFGILAISGFATYAATSEHTRNLHQEAVLAVSDIDAAIGELNAASNITATNAEPYRQSAQRAVNAIVGAGAPHFASAGDPGDNAGALDHLSWLSTHASASAWGPAVQGALVNVKVAQAHLAQAKKADQLEELVADLGCFAVPAGRVRAVVATGCSRGLARRVGDYESGVPADGKIVSGCTVPTEAPAYGVTKGFLTYLALPRTSRRPVFRKPSASARDISVRGNAIVVSYAAVDLIDKLCPDVRISRGYHRSGGYHDSE